MPSPTLVGLGEILWDLLPDGRQLGGAPANFAYHARALGARSVLVSRIGDDDLGREIRDRVQAFGVDGAYVSTDPEHPTGTVAVDLDADGKPTFTIHPNVAWDHIPFGRELAGLAGAADAVCFGTLGSRSPLSRATVQRVLDATRPDCLRVFDINLRQHYHSPELIGDLLERATVLKLNDDELPAVAEFAGVSGDDTDCVRRLARVYGLAAVALTRGDRGSILAAGDAVSTHAGVPMPQVADTVGAGDAFTAALTMGLVAGDDIDTISERANRLAAYVCSQPGATPPIPAELRVAR